MGDRVLIIFKSDDNGHSHAPAVYGHWSGHEMPELLAAATEAGWLRKGDVGYSAARLCGWMCKQSDGCTGVGIIAAPDDLSKETLTKFSHGDAGVLVVDVDTGEVETFGGYTKPFRIAGKDEAASAMLAVLAIMELYEVEEPGTFLEGDVKLIKDAIAQAETAGIKSKDR